MRYTTIIDITEETGVYRNKNARLLYMHLVLKAGYHDDDRDTTRLSIRQMADGAGISVSACRHALKILTDANLVSKEDGQWRVLKWVAATPPTPRTQKNTAKTENGKTSIAQQYDEQLKEWQTKVLDAVRASSPEELKTWLQELKEGKRLYHHRISLNPSQANIQWLTSIVNKL